VTDETSSTFASDDATPAPTAPAAPSPITLASVVAADDAPITDAPAGDTSAADGAFAALGLDPALVAALATLGYEEPTPVQRETIPPLLAGRDLLGQAATGTGKTAAFALPMLQRIHRAADGAVRPGPSQPQALILVPTRELAMQVAEAVHKYGKGLGTRVLAVYGGQAIDQQLRALRRGVDVVVATPGRAVDHLDRGTMDLSRVRVAVLDEADEMMDMGFADELDAILGKLPPHESGRQTALFSATMPPRIAAIAERHLREPVRVSIARERTAPGEAPRVRQVAYVVSRQWKLAALGRVLDMEGPTSAIVFCRTRGEVDELAETLTGRGYRADALHGGLSQEQRDRVMRRFRDGTAELLVATDVAARGLDVEHVSHVVNYDVPSAAEVYVHRIGRTGRAGREGVAITLAEPREHRLLRNIEHATGSEIRVEAVPTVVDLRTRRLELLQASLRDMLVADGFDHYRVVVESLSDEFDVMDIAMAAIQLAHTAEQGDAAKQEEEIPQLTFGGGRGARDHRRPSGRSEGRFERGGRPERGGGFDRGERPDRGGERGERGERRPSRFAQGPSFGDGPREGGREERFDRGPRPERGERGERGAPRRGAAGARLFIGLGREAGVRPADLMGAIVNEAGVNARDIGTIDIGDRFSVVEVPRHAADEVVRALRDTTIRGRRVMARRDREEQE
jgi:ATP-dependent RNA helicase DeaD